MLLDVCFKVFQRRQDGSVEFYRNWTQYETGFGDIEGEFWLGNRNIHTISTASGKSYDLRIDLDDGYDTRFAVYDSFYITGSGDNYTLNYGTYLTTSNAGKYLLTFSTIRSLVPKQWSKLLNVSIESNLRTKSLQTVF